jgi:trigger factor
MMQVTETLNEGLKREFKVVVPAATLEKEMMGKLTDLAGRAQIKGFRPGKVPVPHLKRLYGKSVMAEVVQKHIDEDAKKLLEERQIKPAYQPEVKLPEDKEEVDRIFDGKSDFAYTMAFEVVPAFELQDVSGIELQKHVVAIEDAYIAEALGRVAQALKTFSEKDGEAAKGDRVTVSFVGKVDGEAFEGGTAENVPVEIGSGQFIPGFEDQLIGAKAGEDKTITATFPEGYAVPKLAGKTAEFATMVAKVETPTVPEINEEMAKNIGFESLEKFRDNVREQLSREFGQMTGMKLKRDVLDALDKTYSFDLPQRLVEAEFNGIWNALTREMARERKSFEDEGTTEEKARAEYRGIAERRVRLGLVLGTMGEKESIQISDEEMRNALMARARQFRGQEKQVIEHYQKNPNALIELRGPIFEQKVVDLIVSRAKVTDKTVTREELQALVRDEDEHDHVHDHDHDHDHDHHHHDHDHDHHHHDHDHGHDHTHDDHKHDH